MNELQIRALLITQDFFHPGVFTRVSVLSVYLKRFMSSAETRGLGAENYRQSREGRRYLETD